MNTLKTHHLFSLGLIAALLGWPPAGLRAQPNLTPGQIAALQQIDPSAAPEFGNYWLLKGRDPDSPTPPLPCIPTVLRTLNLPIYALSTNEFLIDDSSVDWGAIDEANADDQSLSMLDSLYGEGENGFPDGSLWLALALTNDPTYGAMAALTLNGTTNDAWYEVLSKRSLTDPDWWSEGSLPGLTEPPASQASVTADSTATNLFLWVRALANGSGGTLPISWQLQNFARTGLDPSAAPGGQGLSLLEAYREGAEPNYIQFSVTATNNYVPASPAPVQLEITSGVPFYQAVLVDTTNAASAAWSPCASTNLSIDLGSAEGWHDVWVGLKGFAATSHQTWVPKRLKLDRTPPQLSLLSPAPGVVTQPKIQLVGSCPEALGAIWYDLSNATLFLPHQPVIILDQFLNTNTWEFTTNSFQAFDVKLAPGTNLITLHAADLAGNQSVTRSTFILDYSNKTNPPALQLEWPPNGAQIAAATFTLHGWTDDPTAKLRARVTRTNGIPRTFVGLVERTGKFWVDNIRLAGGTNLVALTLTDAAGHSSLTNISVVQSAVRVTMNPVTPASQLWQPTVTVTGTLSDPAYAVWVNGVKASNPGNGTWTATNVPVTSGGAALFQMTAYSPAEQQPDGSYGR